jgi:eight-cysteine-cluster-containing protein
MADADCGTDSTCSVSYCAAGSCASKAINDGFDCDDGDDCTAGETCMLGQCQGGQGVPGCYPMDDDGDGYTKADGDCDDSNAAISPIAIEICDQLDNDCDGQLDENCQEACVTGGCSGELCGEPGVDLISDCAFLEEYKCLQYSQCGRFGENGACAWLQTPEYLSCLDHPSCTDLSNVDFGACEMAMGYGFVNGKCTMISGCGCLDSCDAIFDSVEACEATCGTTQNECISAGGSCNSLWMGADANGDGSADMMPRYMCPADTYQQPLTGCADYEVCCVPVEKNECANAGGFCNTGWNYKPGANGQDPATGEGIQPPACPENYYTEPLSGCADYEICCVPLQVNQCEELGGLCMDLWGAGETPDPNGFAAPMATCPGNYYEVPGAGCSDYQVCCVPVSSEDQDGDGWTVDGGDCADYDYEINPGVEERCGDLMDNNCDGVADENCGLPCASNEDCPQSDDPCYSSVCLDGACVALAVPGCLPECFDDSQCPDVDGCGKYACVNNQCQYFADPSCGNGCTSDQDCAEGEYCQIWCYDSGECGGVCIAVGPLDNDGDGWTVEKGDCNDQDASVYPGAQEMCNDGLDNDCDGQADEACNEQNQCGGFAGIQCAKSQFCKYEIGTCNWADQMGVCTAYSQACPQYYSPVCGCNGQTYGNPCEADAAGVSLDYKGECQVASACVDKGGYCFDPYISARPEPPCMNGTIVEKGACQEGMWCCIPDATKCQAVDPAAFGMCDALIGFAFTGQDCELLSGCGCGNHCDAFFATYKSCAEKCL